MIAYDHSKATTLDNLSENVEGNMRVSEVHSYTLTLYSAFLRNQKGYKITLQRLAEDTILNRLISQMNSGG